MGKFAIHLGAVASKVGPLFAKELLVTSRRPRYYVLRFAYAAFLGLFIAVVWLGFIRTAASGTAAYRISRMAEMGKRIVSTIVCFQFGAAQLVAIVLLSTSISEEIYQRTLVPLLTTPVGYGQIVVGKFLGKLLHVLLLLAISLPLMGLVRVLGGVPWGYLLAGLCITITAAMFTGSVAMLFSILCRRAYLSMLAALGVVVGLYAMVGLVLVIASAILSAFLGMGGWSVLLYTNPVSAMTYETIVLNNPAARVPGFYWPGHCAIMLAMVFGVLWVCEVLVRRLAVRKAIGLGAAAVGPGLAPLVGEVIARPVLSPVAARPTDGTGPPPLPVTARPAPAPARAAPPLPPAPPVRKKRKWKPRGWRIERMVGSPIVWRELRKPLLRDKVVQIVATCAVAFYLLYTYAMLAASGALDEPGWQAFFVLAFLLAGMLCTAMDAATSIAPEKQARTWAALLSTPVSDWHILLGKAGGTAFRCLPVWLFLAGHVLFFTLVGFLHPLAILHLGLLAVALNLFLTCSGVYFSTRYRRTTTAVLMNLALALVLWLLIPTAANLLGEAFGDWEISDGLLSTNPVVQAWVVTVGACRPARNRGPAYTWPDGPTGSLKTTLLVLASSAGYVGAAVLLAWRTKRRLRQDVFAR